MSFLNPDKESQGAQKVHVRSYSWSGGNKPIDPNDPEKGEKPFVKVKYYEGSGQSKVDGELENSVPMKLAVLGQTFQVTGYDKGSTPGSETSYFSNETVEFGQEMVVFKKDAKGFEEIARGSYKQVKDQLGKNIKCQYNVYFYDLERKCIDRFQFKGSSYTEWGDYKKGVRKNIYTGYTLMDKGELKRFDVGVAIVPKFELQAPYTDEEIAEITEAAKKYEEYEQSLLTSGESLARDEYNQAPPHYDGEGSQELPDAPIEDNGEEAINLSDIPF